MDGSEQRTHYQVWGGTAAAPPPEIRRSYRQLAYLLHPDRQGGGTPAEQRLAERRMREVNAAWTTLSDPVRRRDYDRTLAVVPGPPSTGRSTTAGTTARSATAPSGHPAEDDDPDEAMARARLPEIDPDEPDLSPAHFWLLRRAPIVLALVVGAVLFVVTAYAGGRNETPGSSSPPLAAGSDCVKRTGSGMAYRVSCGAANDGTIVKQVTRVTDCPDDAPYALIDNQYVCVRKSP